MELEQMPQPGPGMCGSDREVFERVWRRVMETGGGESPVEVVPAEEAALPAPAQPLPAPAVPAPAAVDPEDALCCLGPASAAYGGALQRFIEGELQDAVTYAALARRGRHRAAARFAALADQERRHAKRLSTAYFLISGVRYWPASWPSSGGRPPTGQRPRAARTPVCAPSTWSWPRRSRATAWPCGASWRSSSVPFSRPAGVLGPFPA